MDGSDSNHHPSVSSSIHDNAFIFIGHARSFKQVKNWFSNERQKNRVGEMVSLYTEEGDKMRLRLSAFEFSEQWSDSLLEEVAMVYHYLVTQSHRRKKQKLSDHRESSRVMKINGHSSRSLE